MSSIGARVGPYEVAGQLGAGATPKLILPIDPAKDALVFIQNWPAAAGLSR